MALTGPMDITFNDNFKDLPSELKNIVLSYIDIQKLVSYNDPKIEPFIDTYIKHYIDTRLFTDASMFAFLQHAHYGRIIEEKIYEMATIWGKDFMEQCELLNEAPVDKPRMGVCFNIKYSRRSTMYWTDTINTTPIKTSIEYFPNPNNCITFIRQTKYMSSPNINKSKVIGEMASSICHFMNMYQSGIYQIQSIELVKQYRSSAMDDNADGQIIKKYY
jgi:hypothetical protein